MLRRLLSLLRNAAAAIGAPELIVTFTPIVPWTAARLAAGWTDTDRNVLILLIASGDPGMPGGRFIGIETYWRTAYALDAWRSGHFHTILACGQGSAETIKPLLIAYGVPESAILVENRSTRPVPDILKRSGSLQFRWECFWILVEEIGKLGYYGARGWL